MMDNIEILDLNQNLVAVFTDVSRKIFDETDAKPVDIYDDKKGYVPWGESNRKFWEDLFTEKKITTEKKKKAHC